MYLWLLGVVGISVGSLFINIGKNSDSKIYTICGIGLSFLGGLIMLYNVGYNIGYLLG